MRSLRTLLPVLAPLLAAAPLAGQGAEVSLRLGVAGGTALCLAHLVPGVEVRTPGRLHGFGGVDAYLTRYGNRPRCEEPRGPSTVLSRRAETSPPRFRLGAEWGGTAGGAATGVRAYVGQQGVVEGFHPLAGIGAEAGRDGWAVGADGVLHRSYAYELTRDPATGFTTSARTLPRQWLPSVELSARYRVGTVGGARRPETAPGGEGLGRPIVGGIVGGAVGAVAGFYAGALADGGCRGDGGDEDSCILAGFAGALVGESLGIPLGVYLAEHRRGSYPLAALASLGITALGFGAMGLVGDSGPPAQGIWVLVPVAQIGASIAIERRTHR